MKNSNEKIDFDSLNYELARSRQLSQGDRMNVMESLATFAQKLKGFHSELKEFYKILKTIKDNQELMAKALNHVLIEAENKELWMQNSQEDTNGKSL